MEAGDLAVRGPRIGIFQPSQERLAQLGVWFEAEYPSLLRFAYFVVGDTTEAEDLVQDTFVKLYRSTGRIGEIGFKGYARKTILNLHRSRLRRRSSHEPLELAAVQKDRDLAVEDEVWAALLTLSPRQRAVVALRFYEDITETEIASTLDMSVGSVKKHTSRAIAKLRAQLGDQEEV